MSSLSQTSTPDALKSSGRHSAARCPEMDHAVRVTSLGASSNGQSRRLVDQPLLRGLCVLFLCSFILAISSTSHAQPGIDEPVLRSVENIDIVEHLNQQLPLDLKFQNEIGQFVPLQNFFQDGRPVILNLAYFSCPMLCNLVVEGMIDAISQIGWTMGEEFRVLTISIDPRDRPAQARARQALMVEEMGRKDALAGWSFLTGREENIRAVAETVGFGYEWNDYRQEYAHGAALMILTPDGRVSRYLYGVQFDPKVLRLSMIEASDGKVGSTLDKIFLLCYHYDPSIAAYGPMAERIMRAGGVVTLLLLGLLFMLLTRARRRSLASLDAGSSSSDEVRAPMAAGNET